MLAKAGHSPPKCAKVTPWPPKYPKARLVRHGPPKLKGGRVRAWACGRVRACVRVRVLGRVRVRVRGRVRVPVGVCVGVRACVYA